jgi:hypothetical protein
MDNISTKELSPPNFQDFPLKNLAKHHYFLFLLIHFLLTLVNSQALQIFHYEFLDVGGRMECGVRRNEG